MAARAAACAALALALSAAPARALSPAAETALDQGLHALYSLDYDRSRAAFHSLIEQEPDSPYGYLFESGGIWWQASQEYGLFKDTPTLQGVFERDVDLAIAKADGWIAAPDRDTQRDGHFAAGMALGTRGQWDIMKSHYLKAYFDGRHAVKHLKRAAKLDPDWADVDFGLGVFDYEAAHLSGVAKLGVLVGVRGDEARGIRLIQNAVERGRYASRQAAEFLLTLYIVDKHDWKGARPALEKLRREFPESPYFLGADLALRWAAGEREESLKLGRELFAQAKADPDAFDRKLLSLVCGLADDACLGPAQAAASHAWLSAAIAATPEPPSAAPDDEAYLVLLHLYRGQTGELLGAKDQAAQDYAWVLAHPDFAGARQRAAYCLRQGCGRADALAHLKALSKGAPVPAAIP